MKAIFENIPNNLCDLYNYTCPNNSIFAMANILDRSMVASLGFMNIGWAANALGTVSFGIYTLTGNTLTRIIDVSLAMGSSASSAMQFVSIPLGGTYTLNEGAYWFLVRCSTSSAAVSFGGLNTRAGSLSGAAVPWIPIIGRSTATSSALPASFSSNGLGTFVGQVIYMPYIILASV